eukprot:2826648-Rhodomonas_salina.1
MAITSSVHLKAAEHAFKLQYLRSWIVRAGPDVQRSGTRVQERPAGLGYLLSLNNAPVFWKAKRQDCVTLSSAEAEYVAASMAGQEVIYLRVMLRGFGHEQSKPTVVWEDKAACIQIANNPVNRKFTRHIDVRCYFVWDLVRDDIMTLVKCAGTHNVANALTKSLQGP